MSAIFGIVNLNGQQVSIEALRLMDSALIPFGSDGDGIWAVDHVGLGQRLMGFTPEDRFEQQPLISSDGKRVLVCDGRLDNRYELIATLGVNSLEAKQIPDSAFILKAYEKWGCDCALYLVGEYSFALWDDRTKHLLLTCSPLGGRPLFYFKNSDFFAFSTAPQGLFKLPFIPRRLNLERIADYLTWVPKEPGSSFFESISFLRSGYSLKISRDNVRMKQFWNFDLQRELRYAKDADYVDAFNELFGTVVSDQMRSMTPIGVMMSGGLDSCSVAATAAQLLSKDGKRLATFTEVPRPGFDGLIPPNYYADETTLVQEMSRLYDNLDVNLVNTDGRTYLENLHNFFDVAYLPFRNASNRVWYESILKTARQQGIRVMLTGGQGNLTISRNGDGLLPQLIRTGKWHKAFGEAAALCRNHGTGSIMRTILSQGVVPLLPNHLWHSINRLRGRGKSSVGNLPWSGHSAILPSFAEAQRVHLRAQLKGHDFTSRLRADLRKSCAEMLPGLTEGNNGIAFTYQAMYGMDLRDPTADRRIVEFCLSLPEEQYLKDGVSRRLIRRAMSDKLPSAILNNNKRGLQAADWFERLFGAREQILELLTEWNNSVLVPAVLDLERLRYLAKQMPQVRGDASTILTEYRMIMDYGLMTGSFIRWFETTGALCD